MFGMPVFTVEQNENGKRVYVIPAAQVEYFRIEDGKIFIYTGDALPRVSCKTEDLGFGMFPSAPPVEPAKKRGKKNIIIPN